MRTSIQRARLLPEWLEDGARYGEHGAHLQLDKCAVQIIRLRANSHRLLRRLELSTIDSTERHTILTVAQSLAAECLKVDAQLESWAENLPVGWTYERYSIDRKRTPSLRSGKYHDFTYSGTVHVYPSLKIAISWNFLRSCRVILNSIILAIWKHQFSLDKQCHDISKAIHQTLTALVTDICESASFYFDHGNMNTTSSYTSLSNMSTTIGNAKSLVFLINPMLVAAGAFGVPETQHEWIKRRVALIGRATGNGTLERVATVKHPC